MKLSHSFFSLLAFRRPAGIIGAVSCFLVGVICLKLSSFIFTSLFDWLSVRSNFNYAAASFRSVSSRVARSPKLPIKLGPGLLNDDWCCCCCCCCCCSGCALKELEGLG